MVIIDESTTIKKKEHADKITRCIGFNKIPKNTDGSPVTKSPLDL